MLQVAIEVGIGVGTKCTAEYTKRGKDFNSQVGGHPLGGAHSRQAGRRRLPGRGLGSQRWARVGEAAAVCWEAGRAGQLTAAGPAPTPCCAVRSWTLCLPTW